MDLAEHVAHLEQDGARLAAAASDLDAAVPSCPQWTVRDVVTHLGGVHRWAASIVRDRLDHDPAPGEDDLATPDGRDLLTWYREGHAELLQVLRDADPDVQCYTFMRAPSPLAFWARRQAHETAIHRADVEAAVPAEAPGPTVGAPRAAAARIRPFDSDFAADGIDEMLTGFAARRRSVRGVEVPRTVAIRPDDGAGWTVTLRPDGIRAEPGDGDGDADCTVRGSTSDLYLWLWNRPGDVVVSGDQDVAALWRGIRVR